MDHCVAPPTSMYSMKRGSIPRCRLNSTMSPSSSSLIPFTTTVSSLTLAKWPPNGFNAFEHPCMDIPPCQIPECLRPESIQAHGDPMQPCVAKSLSLLSKKYPVSRESEVLDQGISGEHPNQPGEIPAQQRFPAGKVDVVHTESCENIN